MEQASPLAGERSPPHENCSTKEDYTPTLVVLLSWYVDVPWSPAPYALTEEDNGNEPPRGMG